MRSYAAGGRLRPQWHFFVGDDVTTDLQARMIAMTGNNDTRVSMNPKELARFWANVEKRADGCWRWTAYKNWGGYGGFSIRGKPGKAHRISYEHFIGKIPEGLVTDHLCRRCDCVNPAHMEVVTQRVNLLRGVGACAKNYRKTHCIHGHSLSGANLYMDPDGQRECRICRKTRRQRHSEATKAFFSPPGESGARNQTGLAIVSQRHHQESDSCPQ